MQLLKIEVIQKIVRQNSNYPAQISNVISKQDHFGLQQSNNQQVKLQNSHSDKYSNAITSITHIAARQNI